MLNKVSRNNWIHLVATHMLDKGKARYSTGGTFWHNPLDLDAVP